MILNSLLFSLLSTDTKEKGLHDTPALFTNMSTRPCILVRAFTKSRIDVKEARSICMYRIRSERVAAFTVAESAESSWISCVRAVSPISQQARITVAPKRANALAVSYPMPKYVEKYEEQAHLGSLLMTYCFYWCSLGRFRNLSNNCILYFICVRTSIS